MWHLQISVNFYLLLLSIVCILIKQGFIEFFCNYWKVTIQNCKFHLSHKKPITKSERCTYICIICTSTNLLSLACSFLSRTFSHLRSRNRLRRGEALGVELLDQAASSSLDGVISMEGSWRYSLEAERELGCRRSPFSSRSLGNFFILLIFKRRRRRVGVEELDQTRPSCPPSLPASASSPWLGSSRGTCTWKDGGRRVSVMLRAHHPCRCDRR